MSGGRLEHALGSSYLKSVACWDIPSKCSLVPCTTLPKASYKSES